MIIYGLNPVLEALRAGRVRGIRTSRRSDQRMQEVLQLAVRARVPIQQVETSELDRAARGGQHQGVVAEVEQAPDHTVQELVAGASRVPLIVVLDGVEDPHNFGAILRVADAAGVDGVVRQRRHAAAADGAAAKASAGAMAHVRMANVVNIARAIDELKAANVWTVGLAGDARQRYSELDLTLPTALVLGAEGTGLRRLVRERCDILASLPMQGHVESLNVSVAAGIVLFEAVRQREGAAGGGPPKRMAARAGAEEN
ncbi:MAG: 23S rRNA (guanosine(2251)-2'-O)-methyltransferase RlmB [Acidobacteria bacterium]|nr:MAG: 23S rRNA (guanosine(2251)-2'-O)-methyltransferase RlmB [Acidobacteriota bacterium]